MTIPAGSLTGVTRLRILRANDGATGYGDPYDDNLVIEPCNDPTTVPQQYDDTWVGCGYDFDVKLVGQLNSVVNISEDDKKVFVEPNPVLNTCYLHHPTDLKIRNVEVYATTGQKFSVDQVAGPNVDELNLSDLNSGLYFLHVTYENGLQESLRVIKQ